MPPRRRTLRRVVAELEGLALERAKEVCVVINGSSPTPMWHAG